MISRPATTQSNYLLTVVLQGFKVTDRGRLFTNDLNRSGRTDKGVSAYGQVISLYVRSNMVDGVGVIPPLCLDEEDLARRRSNQQKNKKPSEEFPYVKMLNGVLPAHIRVLAWTPVPFHFNARFSTLYRTYKYFFSPSNLDLGLMSQASKLYIGEYDYRNFCKMDIESVKSFIRVILSFEIEPMRNADGTLSSELYVATISGYAFLWHQIRCMMAMLFLVGQKKYPVTIISDLLDLSKGISKPQYEMASETPLVLFDCGYEDLDFIYDQDSYQKVINTMTTILNEHHIKTSVTRLMLND
ncbi:hypothetical protein SAMD00019534_112920, partial [Acytostelium subglobosum LB1]|uniref:hypothetical protein n=1 Tax=Acytostelium subglobosum LB1 TaxID=1410327 RepID=UPI000644AE88